MKSIRVRAFRSLASACVLATLAMPMGRAQTYKEGVIHSFAGYPDDGANPYAGLILDLAGSLYGTTEGGGSGTGPCPAGGCGVVFELSKTGAETVLYNFCSQPDCADGAISQAGLIEGADGNLYGTTVYGGDCSLPGAPPEVHTPGCGAVFKLSKAGGETVLHSFTSGTDVTDGLWPRAGLVRDSAGNLYGTTAYGGGTGCDLGGCGAIFKIDTKGNETVLYSFCRLYACTDGAYPFAGLVRDAGSLYGTTEAGGSGVGLCGEGCGTVFQIDQLGSLAVLYNFCSQPACTDGANPYGGVIEDSAGNLYGTTLAGGGTGCGGVGCGTVFKIDEYGEETVLYNFCSQPNCTDGASPVAGLIRDSAGNLYGTTAAGGSNDGGTVFRIDTSGKETVLYSFCSQSNCTDGQYPVAGLIRDSKGNLYGTTEFGGAANSGVVFKLTP